MEFVFKQGLALELNHEGKIKELKRFASLEITRNFSFGKHGYLVTY
jgi:hypothetical protein